MSRSNHDAARRWATRGSRIGILGAATLGLLLVAACGEDVEERAATGGLGGAAAGAVIGGPVGAVVGGAAGAAGGTAVSKGVDEKAAQTEGTAK